MDGLQTSKVTGRMSYILGHFAAGTAWVTVVVGLPLVATLVLAFISNDPGGPLFWPMFVLLLLACGLASAGILSILTAGFDLLTMRRRLPCWLPPAIVASFALLVLGWASRLQAPLWLYPASAMAAGVVFAIYRAIVSSFWFLPSLILRILSERVRFPYTTRKYRA